jgi:hypothetical protein
MCYNAVLSVLGEGATDGIDTTEATVRLGEMKKRVAIDPVTKKVRQSDGHPVMETGEVADCVDLVIKTDEDRFYIKWR